MTDYTLTRRDALKALGAAGITVAGGATALTWADQDTRALTDHDRETLVAVGRTVYPSAVSNVAEFVEAYVAGRLADDPGRADALSDAVELLDGYALEWERRRFSALDPETRDDTLRGFGVDTADPDPKGAPRQRVRYYLVNDLQYALYTSPTGGNLVGIENPQGHPGGTTSYRQPPDG